MKANLYRCVLVVGGLVFSFILLRVYLNFSPSTNLNIGPYNVHHLYTGILLMLLGGMPLAILQGSSRLLDLSAFMFGVGLGMALDEWVYLIATDGSDSAYSLPVSLWGGIIMTLLGAAYGVLIYSFARRRSIEKSGKGT